MKSHRSRKINTGVILVAALVALRAPARAQDEPRVFVQGKGSENLVTTGSGGWGKRWAAWGSNSTRDSHDEAMEVIKDLQNNCAGVMVTLNPANADYSIMLNRESKHNRGLLRTNSQLQVANRAGDVIGSGATRTVGHAAKDACESILADWQSHGRLHVAPFVPPVLRPTSETASAGVQTDSQKQPAIQAEEIAARPSGVVAEPNPPLQPGTRRTPRHGKALWFALRRTYRGPKWISTENTGERHRPRISSACRKASTRLP